MKKRYIIPLVIVLLIAVVYAAAPLWSPALIRSQLPTGWQLLEADVGYPGPGSVAIKRLQFSTAVAGSELIVTAGPGVVFYSGRKVEIQALSITTAATAPDQEALPFSAADLSVPLLAWSGKLPDISVGKLDVDLSTALPAVQFLNLGIDSGEAGPQKFRAGFFVRDIDSINGQLEAALAPDSFEAALWMTNSADEPLLEVSLTQRIVDSSAGSDVMAEVHLGGPEFPRLAAAFFPTGPYVPSGLSGDLIISARFGGGQQLLQELNVASPELHLQLDNEIFSTSFGFAAGLAGEQVTVSSVLPARVSYAGQTERLSGLLKALIPEFTARADEQTERAHGAELTIEQGSRLEFEIGMWRQASFAGSAELAVSTPAIQLDSMTFRELQFQAADLEELEVQRLSADLEFSASTKSPFSYVLDDASLQADSITLHSLGRLQLYDDTVHYETAEPLNARLQNMVVNLPSENGSAALEILAADFTLETLLSSNDAAVITAGSGTLSGGQIAAQDISAETVHLRWDKLDLDKQEGSFTVRTEGLLLAIDTEDYRGINPDIGCSISGNGDMGCKGRLLFLSGPSLPIDVTGNVKTEHWKVVLLPTEIMAANARPILNALNLPLPQILKLNAGTVRLSGGVKMDPEVHGNIAITGESVSFSVKKSIAEELSFTLDLGLGERITASGAANLKNATLAAGLVLENIAAGLGFDGENGIIIDSIGAGLFNGTMSMNSLEIIDGAVQDSEVRMTAADLEAILAFADINGLTGSGVLEFVLPLGSDSSGLFIRDGKFYATAPGILSYAAADKAAIADNIGLQALANFHYASLDGNINYSSAGEYQLRAHISGNNPDLYDGYPIDLNLNIGGVLPELFEVLFLTGDFEEAILERIRIK